MITFAQIAFIRHTRAGFRGRVYPAMTVHHQGAVMRSVQVDHPGVPLFRQPIRYSAPHADVGILGTKAQIDAHLSREQA